MTQEAIMLKPETRSDVAIVAAADSGGSATSPSDTDQPSMPWFHGKISRETAEKLLTPRRDGLFLVRESTNFPGDYTLCVCFEGRVEHYRIILKEEKITIDEEEYFDSLPSLVEHYQVSKQLIRFNWQFTT
jgi:c-src tyrosine kinase